MTLFSPEAVDEGWAEVSVEETPYDFFGAGAGEMILAYKGPSLQNRSTHVRCLWLSKVAFWGKGHRTSSSTASLAPSLE